MNFRVGAFDTRHFDTIISWVRTEDDLRTLAPRTTAPLTAPKILAWHDERCNPLLLFTTPDEQHHSTDEQHQSADEQHRPVEDRPRPSDADKPANNIMIGYGEINRAVHAAGSYWLGHIIIDPDWRGAGAGRWFVRELLNRAFDMHKARHVALIVFPENVAAIRCYTRCGFQAKRDEHHSFCKNGRRFMMRRMELDYQTWLQNQTASV